MTGSVEFKDTDGLVVAITITMPLEQWKRVARDIGSDSASCAGHKVRALIQAAVRAAEERIDVNPPTV